jgi:cytochrome P450
MVHYPDVMRKAQAQIDSVVGRDRVPTFADRPHLPYLRALVKELLRWRPAGPMGMQISRHCELLLIYSRRNSETYGSG